MKGARYKHLSQCYRIDTVYSSCGDVAYYVKRESVCLRLCKTQEEAIKEVNSQCEALLRVAYNILHNSFL